MNILQLTHIFPYPLDDGGKISVYHLTRQFSRLGAHVYYAGLQPYAPETQHVEAIRQWCRDMLLVPVDRRYTAGALIRNVFSSVPINIHKYHSRKILRAIHRFAADKRIHLIHTDHLHMAYYGLALRELLGTPAVLRAHNLEMKIMKRFAEHHRNPIVRTYARLQARRFLQYEPMTCRAFDRCLMITREDEETLRQMAPDIRTDVIPAGVDTEFFRPQIESGEKDTIAWIGNLEWWPNVHGLMRFVETVLPRLLRIKPSLRLAVYGKGADDGIRALHDGKNIFVKGFVADIRDAFRSANVLVVPLYVGSGIRIKILEGMASGKAIVTTTVGCEGIDTQGMECYDVATSPDEFATKLCELLDNEERRIRLGTLAAKVVSEYYSWDAIGKRFMSCYEKLVRNTQCSGNGRRAYD